MNQVEQRLDPIVRSVEIRATPERLFVLLIEPDALVRWWPDLAELEPRIARARTSRDFFLDNLKAYVERGEDAQHSAMGLQTPATVSGAAATAAGP